ncbi:hypothetical protein Dimus_026404 [Dionaea muscipula]
MLPRSTKLAHMVLTREGNQGERYLSKISDCRAVGIPAAPAAAIRNQASSERSSSSELCDWVPHPRTGIYFPKGHEWVMEDVPHEAASPEKTYWLRSIDGVEKPDPELSSDHYLQYSTFQL